MTRLNAAQRAAVTHDRGPLLVLAGAGSGKTGVITHRIARLVKKGVRPEAILAVSFTNKAAAEMHERMIPLVGREQADRLWLSTFHRFGVRFLGEESVALGYSARFVIFDQGDSLGAVREIVRREGIGEKRLDLAAVLARISLWKNRMLVPDAVPASDFEYDAVAREVYPHYEAALRSMCAVDFDDLVMQPVRILSEHAVIRDRWRNRFEHLLVDEFQDTNHGQLELVRLLANPSRNVCVVGDDDQSIYGWRGAEVGNILDFEAHFAGAKVVKLEDNYRSRSPILAVANAAIARSKRKRHEKVLRAARGEGAPVRLSTLGDSGEEARFVVLEIQALRAEGITPERVAVLYRSNGQARLFEEELRGAQIPYRVFGGQQFFDRKEVKDAVAYLRAVVHPRDEIALRRVLNYPVRGIGDQTVAQLSSLARAEGISFRQALSRIDELPAAPDGAKRGAERLLAALGRAKTRFEEGADLAGAAQTLFEEVGLAAALRDPEERTPAALRRFQNLEHVVGQLGRHQARPGGERPSLAQFLARMSLGGEESSTDRGGGRVTLSSLHAAKGLEFDVVFLVGLNEGQLPHSRTTDPKLNEAAPTDVEEERRLFYVGVTRARERLYLTRPLRRLVRGRVAPLTPTRFLEGLPEEHLEIYCRDDAAPVEADEAVDLGNALLAQLRGG